MAGEAEFGTGIDSLLGRGNRGGGKRFKGRSEFDGVEAGKAHFALQRDAGALGIEAGGVESDSEPSAFQTHADEVDFGHSALADTNFVIADDLLEPLAILGQQAGDECGAGSLPVGEADACSDLPLGEGTLELLAGDGGSCRFEAAIPLAPGLEGLLEIGEVVSVP